MAHWWPICNRFSKAHPIFVPMRGLHRVLAAAVELLLLPAGDVAAAVRALAAVPANVVTVYPPAPPAGSEGGPLLAGGRPGHGSRLGCAGRGLAWPPAPSRADDPAALALLDADSDLQWSPGLATAWAAAGGGA